MKHQRNIRLSQSRTVIFIVQILTKQVQDLYKDRNVYFLDPSVTQMAKLCSSPFEIEALLSSLELKSKSLGTFISESCSQKKIIKTTFLRVEYFAFFENLVFAIISKMLRILTEHIEQACRSESKLFLISLCSIRILNIQEAITKTTFSKIAKCTTLA